MNRLTMYCNVNLVRLMFELEIAVFIPRGKEKDSKRMKILHLVFH